MKIISVMHPYAYLLLLPKSDQRHKRVENRRKWHFKHRGPTLIHASKSMDMIDLDPSTNLEMSYEPGIEFGDLHFGAIIGVVDIIEIYTIEQIHARAVKPEHAWVYNHRHTEGPCCLLTESPKVFARPIQCRGMLGIFEYPETSEVAALVREQLAQAIAVDNLPSLLGRAVVDAASKVGAA